jgi:ABC-2 type transport system ATP-binding protein
MIHIDHLIKAFEPGIRALDDISLHVAAGEVFGFLGPNGAGKTTTIKILTTLLRPTSGTVTVAGHNVDEDPLAVRMSFGYIGQQIGVDPALTVSENMLLQGRLYHLPKKIIEERMEILLDLFDMSGRGGQWVGSLSGGLKRRVDIATALIHKPKLLFLDEPTIGLDPKSRSDLWAYLRHLNKEEGMTLFLTSHYLDEVDQLSTRVGILDNGRLRIIGTPDELKNSLGQDAIHLTFDQALRQEMLSAFREKEWFKEVIQQGEELRLYLENGQELLPKVLQWLDALGLSVKSVGLARPTFDDVYLKYTGKNWLLSESSDKEEWGSWGGAKNNKWAKKWKKKALEPPTGRDKNTEKGGEDSWKQWGGQAKSGWPEGQEEPPNQEWPRPKDLVPISPLKEVKSTPEEPWEKWRSQANTEASSDPGTDADTRWPEKKGQGEAEWPNENESDTGKHG